MLARAHGLKRVRLRYDEAAIERGQENEPISTHSSLSEAPVSWMLDGIAVHATVTHPPAPGPFPAVVFVAGSGPTDRNWNTSRSRAQVSPSDALTAYNAEGAVLDAETVAAIVGWLHKHQ